MIHKGSRYEKCRKITIQDSMRGKVAMISRRLPIKFKNQNDFTPHLIVEGETLDYLAKKYFGDPQKWWVILEANTQYEAPWDIEVGDTLYIPAIKALREG